MSSVQCVKTCPSEATTHQGRTGPDWEDILQNVLKTSIPMPQLDSGEEGQCRGSKQDARIRDISVLLQHPHSRAACYTLMLSKAVTIHIDEDEYIPMSDLREIIFPFCLAETCHAVESAFRTLAEKSVSNNSPKLRRCTKEDQVKFKRHFLFVKEKSLLAPISTIKSILGDLIKKITIAHMDSCQNIKPCGTKKLEVSKDSSGDGLYSVYTRTQYRGHDLWACGQGSLCRPDTSFYTPVYELSQAFPEVDSYLQELCESYSILKTGQVWNNNGIRMRTCTTAEAQELTMRRANSEKKWTYLTSNSMLVCLSDFMHLHSKLRVLMSRRTSTEALVTPHHSQSEIVSTNNQKALKANTPNEDTILVNGNPTPHLSQKKMQDDTNNGISVKTSSMASSNAEKKFYAKPPPRQRKLSQPSSASTSIQEKTPGCKPVTTSRRSVPSKSLSDVSSIHAERVVQYHVIKQGPPEGVPNATKIISKSKTDKNESLTSVTASEGCYETNVGKVVLNKIASQVPTSVSLSTKTSSLTTNTPKPSIKNSGLFKQQQSGVGCNVSKPHVTQPVCIIPPTARFIEGSRGPHRLPDHQYESHNFNPSRQLLEEHKYCLASPTCYSFATPPRPELSGSFHHICTGGMPNNIYSSPAPDRIQYRLHYPHTVCESSQITQNRFLYPMNLQISQPLCGSVHAQSPWKQGPIYSPLDTTYGSVNRKGKKRDIPVIYHQYNSTASNIDTYIPTLTQNIPKNKKINAPDNLSNQTSNRVDITGDSEQNNGTRSILSVLTDGEHDADLGPSKEQMQKKIHTEDDKKSEVIYLEICGDQGKGNKPKPDKNTISQPDDASTDLLTSSSDSDKPITDEGKKNCYSAMTSDPEGIKNSQSLVATPSKPTRDAITQTPGQPLKDDQKKMMSSANSLPEDVLNMDVKSALAHLIPYLKAQTMMECMQDALVGPSTLETAKYWRLNETQPQLSSETLIPKDTQTSPQTIPISPESVEEDTDAGLKVEEVKHKQKPKKSSRSIQNEGSKESLKEVQSTEKRKKQKRKKKKNRKRYSLDSSDDMLTWDEWESNLNLSHDSINSYMYGTDEYSLLGTTSSGRPRHCTQGNTETTGSPTPSEICSPQTVSGVNNIDDIRIQWYRKCGQNIAYSGFMLYKDLRIPFVLRNGYKHILLKDAALLFPGCSVGCTIPRTVLQDNLDLVHTILSYEEMQQLELLMAQSSGSRRVFSGIPILRLDRLLELLPILRHQVAAAHVNTPLKKSQTCVHEAKKEGQTLSFSETTYP